MVEISTDTMHYSLLTPYGGGCIERLHFFDGINIWFSTGDCDGDACFCTGCGYFDTKTKENKMFSFSDLDIKNPGIPYYHMTYGAPSIFALFNNDLWMGTLRSSDYGPEPHGEGIYVFDINKKSIKKHIRIGNGERSPSVLDMSFSPNYLWIATTLGVYRLHRNTNTWSYWKLDTCAIIADSVLDLSLGDSIAKFYKKITKGSIVRLIGQSGGGYESQMHTGSTIKAPFLLEGWIYNSTTNYSNLTSGDTVDLRSFKLYERPDTSSALLTSYSKSYHNFNPIKAIYCENQGDWHRIKLCQIWIPFDDLIYNLRKCAINEKKP
jgi:hypothetical protein